MGAIWELHGEGSGGRTRGFWQEPGCVIKLVGLGVASLALRLSLPSSLHVIKSPELIHSPLQWPLLSFWWACPTTPPHLYLGMLISPVMPRISEGIAEP